MCVLETIWEIIEKNHTKKKQVQMYNSEYDKMKNTLEI